LKKLKILLLFGILFVFVASCQVWKTDQPVTEEIPQIATHTVVDTIEKVPSMTVEAITMTPKQFATVKVLSTRTKTPLPQFSPTIASWVRIAPKSAVPLPTAKANIAELLKTNGGCSLPCWWGIEPGKTNYTTAFQLLSPLASFITVKTNDDKGSLDAEFRIPVSEANSNWEISITLKVEKEIIQLIELSPRKVNQYRFRQLLIDYGNPDEIWIEGVISRRDNNPFTIFFYYPQKGILATFWVDAVDLGDKFQVCPGAIPPIILDLWKPDGVEDFIDFTEKTYQPAYVKKERRSFISFEQATDQTLDEMRKRNCFETPKNIWPAR
jgi:hypothetical protein